MPELLKNMFLARSDDHRSKTPIRHVPFQTIPFSATSDSSHDAIAYQGALTRKPYGQSLTCSKTMIKLKVNHSKLSRSRRSGRADILFLTTFHLQQRPRSILQPLFFCIIINHWYCCQDLNERNLERLSS